MARKIFETATLRVSFLKGYDETGKEQLVTKSFAGIQEDASAEQLEQFAAALATLSTQPVAKTVVATQHTIAQ